MRELRDDFESIADRRLQRAADVAGIITCVASLVSIPLALITLIPYLEAGQQPPPRDVPPLLLAMADPPPEADLRPPEPPEQPEPTLAREAEIRIPDGLGDVDALSRLGPLLTEAEASLIALERGLSSDYVLVQPPGEEARPKQNPLPCVHDRDGWYICPFDLPDVPSGGLIRVEYPGAGPIEVRVP